MPQMLSAIRSQVGIGQPQVKMPHLGILLRDLVDIHKLSSALSKLEKIDITTYIPFYI